MNRPRLHSEREFCLFSNGYGQLIGENIAEARDWIAAHPDYAGKISGDWDTGGLRDDFDASELFESLLLENAERLEKLDATLAEMAAGDKHFRPVPTVLKAMRKAS